VEQQHISVLSTRQPGELLLMLPMLPTTRYIGQMQRKALNKAAHAVVYRMSSHC
jgi:hypothetical protein